MPLPLLTGLDIPYYQIQEAHYPCQLKSLSIVHMCFSIFWNLHPVVFAPLPILHVSSQTSTFQQLLHTITCFITSFRMACYQVFFPIHPTQIHHQLLLLHPLILHNGVFVISPPRIIVRCLMYLWHLRKGWINVIMMFFLLYGMLLYGLCQVNVLGGEGVTFVSLIVNVITSENYLTSLIPTCARKCGCKTSEGKFC